MALDYMLLHRLMTRPMPFNQKEADYAFRIRNAVYFGKAIVKGSIIRWTLSDEWTTAPEGGMEITSCSGTIVAKPPRPEPRRYKNL